MSTPTVPPEKAPRCDLSAAHLNALVATPWYRSPTVWTGIAIGIASLVSFWLPEPWGGRVRSIIGVFTGAGILGNRAISLNAGTQAANRTPGDLGPKIRDALPPGDAP